MHHLARLALGTLLLTGCGSTVPLATRTQNGDGLGGANPAVTASAGTTNSTIGGGRTPSLGTGGGTSGTSGRAGTSTTGGSTPVVPGTGGRVPGQGRHAAPLSIGVLLTETSNASQFGVSLGNTVSERQVDDAVVAGINEHGGLVGRKLVPVYASTDTGSSNWETDFSAACANFTQDHHVEAVLGYVFNYFTSFESCLAKKGIPHLSTGFNVPDREELQKFPLQLDLSVPTVDRRALVKLVNGVADGVLTPKNRLGLLTDTCPGTQTSLQHVLLPKAKQLGLTVAKTISISCSNGNADSASAVSALQSAVLQFASAGVDRVIIHAASEGPALLLFTLSAESQGYRPGYVVSSLANLESLRSYFPAAQVGNIHGYGWLPTQDVPPADYPKPNATQRRCLALLQSKGIKPTAGPDFYYAYNFCEALLVYEQGLLATGADSTGGRVVGAIKALGPRFPSLTNDGGSLFAADRPDAPRYARHLVFSKGCSCFRYTGPARPIPTS